LDLKLKYKCQKLGTNPTYRSMDLHHALEKEESRFIGANYSQSNPATAPPSNSSFSASQGDKNLFLVQNLSTDPHDSIQEPVLTDEDLIDKGTEVIVNSFSDKYAIVLGIALYNHYQSFNLFQILQNVILLSVLIVGLNVLKSMIEFHAGPTRGKDPSRFSLKHFSQDIISNSNNALMVVDVKLFTTAVQQILIYQYDKTDLGTLVLFFAVPFMVLKWIPVLINSDIWEEIQHKRTQLVLPGIVSVIRRDTPFGIVIPHVREFVNNFSEKYSLLVALDLYDYTNSHIQTELVLSLLIALWFLCYLKAMLKYFRQDATGSHLLFWEYTSSMIEYFIQLVVVVEIKYFSSTVTSLCQNSSDDFLSYSFVFIFWIPIVCAHTLTGIYDYSVSEGISEFIDAFLDKYVLLISFEIYTQIHSKTSISDFSLLVFMIAVNAGSFVIQSFFVLLRRQRHLSMVFLWEFLTEIFHYITHVGSLVALKIFTRFIESVALKTQFVLTSSFLLLAPFFVLHLLPIVIDQATNG